MFIWVMANESGLYMIWAGTQHYLKDCMCAPRRLRSACASAQSDQSLRCPLEALWILGFSQSALRRLWPDCADAQAETARRLCWAHMWTCRKCCPPTRMRTGDDWVDLIILAAWKWFSVSIYGIVVRVMEVGGGGGGGGWRVELWRSLANCKIPIRMREFSKIHGPFFTWRGPY